MSGLNFLVVSHALPSRRQQKRTITLPLSSLHQSSLLQQIRTLLDPEHDRPQPRHSTSNCLDHTAGSLVSGNLKNRLIAIDERNWRLKGTLALLGGGFHVDSSYALCYSVGIDMQSLVRVELDRKQPTSLQISNEEGRRMKVFYDRVEREGEWSEKGRVPQHIRT